MLTSRAIRAITSVHLLRWRYGPKRERIDENQMFFFAVGLVGTDKDIPPAPAEPSPNKRKSEGHGRQRLPQHLERRQVVHDLPSEERRCPECQAISYTLSNWAALFRYCEDGDLEIDNNGAILTSFIITCKRLHIDPFAYLRDIFARISAHPQNRLEELLPDKWQATQSPALT